MAKNEGKHNTSHECLKCYMIADVTIITLSHKVLYVEEIFKDNPILQLGRIKRSK